MVVGAPMAMTMLLRFMSAPLVAMEPSRRTRVVDSASPSTTLAFMRKYPAVAAARPLNDQVPDLDSTPAAGAPKVRPAVAATPPVTLPLDVAVMVVTVAASASPLCAAPVPGGAVTVTTADALVAR